MKIDVVSGKEAEIMAKVLVRPYAMIRVGDPDYTLPPLSKNSFCKDIMFLYFYDVDNASLDGKYSKSIFDKIQAEQVLSFILNLDSSVNLLVCHCTAGISRSAGIAAAASLILNGSDKNIFNNSRFVPNMYVYSMILKEAGYEKNKNRKNQINN